MIIWIIKYFSSIFVNSVGFKWEETIVDSEKRKINSWWYVTSSQSRKTCLWKIISQRKWQRIWWWLPHWCKFQSSRVWMVPSGFSGPGPLKDIISLRFNDFLWLWNWKIHLKGTNYSIKKGLRINHSKESYYQHLNDCILVSLINKINLFCVFFMTLGLF